MAMVVALMDDVLSRDYVGDDSTTLLPKSRLGYLVVGVFKKLGVYASIIKSNDFLFFHQLILPMCNPEI